MEAGRGVIQARALGVVVDVDGAEHDVRAPAISEGYAQCDKRGDQFCRLDVATNDDAIRDVGEADIPYLEKYYRPGNAIIVTNDNLARWIRADFPDYHLEASVIKNINTLEKIEKASRIYDTVVLPMPCNQDEAFLKSIEDKSIIRLFANARPGFATRASRRRTRRRTRICSAAPRTSRSEN